jgi:hypothetical protein
VQKVLGSGLLDCFNGGNLQSSERRMRKIYVVDRSEHNHRWLEFGGEGSN